MGDPHSRTNVGGANANNNSSRFVIPKKFKKDVNENPLLPDTLFREINVTESMFQSEVALPFFDNLLISTLRNGARLSNAKRVQNPRLNEKFIRRQNEFRRRGLNTEISYAFMLLDSNDEVEEEYICNAGIYANYSICNELGSPEHGVTLSLHPDCCTPAAFFDQTRQRILICKILKGRCKTVNLKTGGVSFEQRPDPMYNSYTPQYPRNTNLADLSIESPLQRFRYSQIYLYEYNEKSQICDVPTCILPWVTVTVLFSSPGLNVRYLTFPIDGESLVWSGSLKFNNQVIENVEMLSVFRDGIKPPGFSSTLTVDELVPWQVCMHYEPLHQLISSVELCGALVSNRSIRLKQRSGNAVQHYHVSYFTLNQQSSPLFRRIHNTMRRGQTVGLTVLRNNTVVFIITNGELASLLSVPNNFNYPVFHCIFLKIGEKILEEYGIASTSKTSQLSSLERIDFLRAPVKAAIAEFNSEQSVKNMADSRGTCKSSTYFSQQALKIPSSQFTNNPPLPFFVVPPPLISRPKLNVPPLPPGMAINFSDYANSKLGNKVEINPIHPSKSFTVSHKSLPTPYSVPKNDNRQKNQTLIQQTLESLRNVNKLTGPAAFQQPAIFASTSGLPNLLFNQENKTTTIPNASMSTLRDPRLCKVAANDVSFVQNVINTPNEQSKTTLLSDDTSNTAQSLYHSPTRSHSESPEPMEISDFEFDSTKKLATVNETTLHQNSVSPKIDLNLPPLPVSMVNDALRESRQIMTEAKSNGVELGLNSGALAPRFFSDMSFIYSDTNMLSNNYSSFLTSTSKPAMQEKNINLTGEGLNFDFLNWNSQSSTLDENEKNNNAAYQIELDKTCAAAPSLNSNTKNNLHSVQPNMAAETQIFDDDDDEESQQLCIADDDEMLVAAESITPNSPIPPIASPTCTTIVNGINSTNLPWIIKTIPLETILSSPQASNEAGLITTCNSEKNVPNEKFNDNEIEDIEAESSTVRSIKLEPLSSTAESCNKLDCLKNNNEKQNNVSASTKFISASASLIAALPPPGLVHHLNVFSSHSTAKHETNNASTCLPVSISSKPHSYGNQNLTSDASPQFLNRFRPTLLGTPPSSVALPIFKMEHLPKPLAGTTDSSNRLSFGASPQCNVINNFAQSNNLLRQHSQPMPRPVRQVKPFINIEAGQNKSQFNHSGLEKLDLNFGKQMRTEVLAPQHFNSSSISATKTTSHDNLFLGLNQGIEKQKNYGINKPTSGIQCRPIRSEAPPVFFNMPRQTSSTLNGGHASYAFNETTLNLPTSINDSKKNFTPTVKTPTLPLKNHFLPSSSPHQNLLPTFAVPPPSLQPGRTASTLDNHYNSSTVLPLILTTPFPNQQLPLNFDENAHDIPSAKNLLNLTKRFTPQTPSTTSSFLSSKNFEHEISVPGASSSTTLNSKKIVNNSNLFDVIVNTADRMYGREPAIVIIPDPDLVLDFVLTVSDFETILEHCLRWKTAFANRRLCIKWHMCITKALIFQRSVPLQEGQSKCVRFLDLIEEYAQCSLIEYLRDHVCDLSPRNINKYMICCMNAIRQVPLGSRIVFLSETINIESDVSKNFAKNGIELRTPVQLINELKEAEARRNIMSA